MPDRTYTEREVAAIIARAADEQRLGADRADTPGLTLAEIERAGREAGLDPEALRRAAATLDAGGLGLDAVPAGTAVAERWLDGPLRPGAWEDAVARLRLTEGATTWVASAEPDVSTIGADEVWTHTTLFGVRTTVTLSPRGDRTRLRVVRVDRDVADARVMGLVVAGVVSLVVGMLVGAGVAETLGLGDLAGVVAVLLVLAAGMALGGPVLTRRTLARRARQSREVERLAETLARQLVPAAGAEAVDAPAGLRLDLSALDDAPPETEAPASGRRTRA